MVPIKFNFKDIADLNEDIKASPRALSVIIQRVLSLQLRALRRELAPSIPRNTGKLARSFGSSVRRGKQNKGAIFAIFGFLLGKRISAATAIAGNVLQHPGASPSKKSRIWVPVLSNRSAAGGAQITPQQFFQLPHTFVRDTPSGNRIAFQRINDMLVPLFVLKRSVRLSAAPLPLESSVERKLPEITGDIEQAISQVLAARGEVLRVISGGQ